MAVRRDPRRLIQDYVPPDRDDAARTLSPTRLDLHYIHFTDLRKAIRRHAHTITGRVLDYGCGGKPYASLFAGAGEYVGADFPNNREADIHLDADGRLPRGLDGFDAVVSTQVFHHVPDAGVYLSECRRVLAARGGTLLLTTHGTWEYCPSPRDMCRWTHEGLVHVIEAHRFETWGVEPVTTGLKSILQILLCSIAQHRRATGWPRTTRAFYWFFNCLADRLKDEPDVERGLSDFPLCYLYVGKARP